MPKITYIEFNQARHEVSVSSGMSVGGFWSTTQPSSGRPGTKSKPDGKKLDSVAQRGSTGWIR